MLPQVSTSTVMFMHCQDAAVDLCVTYQGRVHRLISITPDAAHRLHEAQCAGIAVPLLLHRPARTLYWHREHLYRDTHGLTVQQAQAILDSRHRQQEVAKVRALTAATTDPAAASRYIPAEVRRAVYARDEGKCQICSSTRDLEFDHVLPVALSGASTVRNVRLLCRAHNRASGARMTL